MSGDRLRQPEKCPKDIYRVMQSCWKPVNHFLFMFNVKAQEMSFLLNIQTDTLCDKFGEPCHWFSRGADSILDANLTSTPNVEKCFAAGLWRVF